MPNGFGLTLASTASSNAPAPIDTSSDPVAPGAAGARVQRVVVATVPAPTLVDGRPS